MDKNKYCVYLHRNKQTNEVYYIGSGVQNKREYHFSGRSKSWHEIHNTCGTIVEIVKSELTQEESRKLEQEIIESRVYPNIVNENTVNPINDIDVNIINEYFTYDETSKSCLRWKKKTGTRSVIGAVAGWFTYTNGKIPRSCNVKLLNKQIRCSRVIWTIHHGNIPPDMIVDHIDGNPHNNRITNLRCISSKENAMNRSAVNYEKELPSGIYFKKGGKKSNDSITSRVVSNKIKLIISFSIDKYGYEQAVENAKIWRVNKLHELGILNDYTERHIGFNPKDYLGKQINYKHSGASGTDYIWTKSKNGSVVNISVGLSNTPRKYFSVSKNRNYDEAMVMAEEYLYTLLRINNVV